MIKRKKVSIIGSGNIGGALAAMISEKNMADVLLVDLSSSTAKGKALDVAQSSYMEGFTVKVEGTSDYAALKDSDAIVVTAGVARKPGMSRDDLTTTNAGVISEIANHIKTYAPDAFVVVITNPLDAMVWLMHKVTGFPKNRIVGMAGVLDSARFSHFLSLETGFSIKDIYTLVLGGHGDLMVPLVRYSTIAGVSLPDAVKMGWMTQDRLDAIVQRTRNGGGEIVDLLSKSAYISPASSAAMMLDSFFSDAKRVLACSAYLDGEYGVSELFVGVPCVIGRNGVEKVIELDLNSEEKQMLEKSIESVKSIVNPLKSMI